MQTLIELSKSAIDLEVALLEADEENQERLITQYLENQENLKVKLDNYCGLVSELEHRAEARRVEAKRLSDRAMVDSNLAKRLKALLLLYMQAHDLKKIETLRFQILKSKNGGKVPLILNENYPVQSIPTQFQKVSVEFDKEQIRLALEAGESLEFAHLAPRKESVRIR